GSLAWKAEDMHCHDVKAKTPRLKEEEQLEYLASDHTAKRLPADLPRRGVSAIYLDREVSRHQPSVITRRGGKRIAFGWYGGKFSHLTWLLPLLPKCHHYCEPFAGSGAVLLNRQPSPVETYNDIDGDVVN